MGSIWFVMSPTLGAKAMKNIVIIGAGALGSHVVQFLRNEGTFTVIDFDRIESKNVMSQFHAKGSVAKSKVEALSAMLNFLWGIKIKTQPRKLEAGNVKQLISGDADLVIDCVDNGATRRLIQMHVREHGLSCLHGALAADGMFGRSCWDEQFVIDDEAGAGAATCEAGEHLPFITVVSGYIARSAQIFLKTGRKVGFEISPGHVIST